MNFRSKLILAMLLLAGTAPVAWADSTPMTWTVDGVQRQAIVVAPPTSKKAVPLVFVFHGHGGNMTAASMRMALQNYWPEAIVVYPQGLPTVTRIDPQGVHPGWQTTASSDGGRDLKFFDTMLDDLHKKYTIDDSRIYATGFSNGAAFSYLLWAERAKKLAALGICAGRLGDGVNLSEARPAVIVAGQNDPIIPFTEQQQSMDAAKKIDKATGAGQACGSNCTLYPSTSQTPVMILIHPGGHMCPPFAESSIVDFFKAHPKEGKTKG